MKLEQISKESKGKPFICISEEESFGSRFRGGPRNYVIEHIENELMSQIGYVFPRFDKEEGVYRIESYIENSRDAEALYYSDSDNKQLRKIRENISNLCDKLGKKGLDWDAVRANWRYQWHKNNEDEILKRNKNKHGRHYCGVTSYEDGAENASKTRALILAHRLAQTKGLKVVDESDLDCS